MGASSNIVDMTPLNRAAEELQRLSGGARPPSGGGGGDMFDMRVQRLEEDVSELRSDMKAVRDDLSDVKARLARLEGKVEGLPSYPGLVGLFGTTVAAIGVMIAVATYILRLPS